VVADSLFLFGLDLGAGLDVDLLSLLLEFLLEFLDELSALELLFSEDFPESLPLSDFVPEVEPELAPLLPSSPERLRLPSFLKSVSYQPLPAKRNPAAETVLYNSGFPQLGQSTQSGSDSFCSLSVSSPQARQLYS